MNENDKAKINIISNYIDWFTSDPKHREVLKKGAKQYVKDHDHEELKNFCKNGSSTSSENPFLNGEIPKGLPLNKCALAMARKGDKIIIFLQETTDSLVMERRDAMAFSASLMFTAKLP